MTLSLSNKTINEIGKRIREIREKKGLTQLQMAEKTGISPSYYARIERGVEKPSLAFIEIVTKSLKIQSSEILPF